MLRDWASGLVEANGIRLHYTRTGGEKLPLVLAHGVTDSGLCWTPLAQALAGDYDLIMVDARGHGQSDAPPAGYGPEVQADDLAGLIEALELRQPAVLGHSMGAATALVLAGRRPDLPGAILLEDPPAWWSNRPEPLEAGDRVAHIRDEAIARKGMAREALIAAQRAQQPRWSEGELEPWADAKQRVSLDVLSVFARANAQNVDWARTLSRITCPEQGGLVTEKSAAALTALVPQTEIAPIADAGHNTRRDQFTRYVDVVRGFLAEHAATISPVPPRS